MATWNLDRYVDLDEELDTGYLPYKYSFSPYPATYQGKYCIIKGLLMLSGCYMSIISIGN